MGVSINAVMRLVCPALVMVCSSGCGESDEQAHGASKPTRVGRTRGGAVVVSRDERVAVVANRSAGVVTVVHLDPAEPAERLLGATHQLDFGKDSEPWAATIGADDDTAYVISRREQSLRRITGLHANPRLDEAEIVSVGSEPTAIAITPSGSHLFVANWAEGTVSIVTTEPLRHASKIDLNESLAATGALGGLAGRPGLAHPRALAMTDDGDDDHRDETLYATEFFSQPLLAREVPTGPTEFDRNRQGIVYPISVRTGQIGNLITIKPVLDTGFFDAPNLALEDAERRPTSCIPNQLYAAAVDGDQLLVTSMCASPSGPVGVDRTTGSTANFKTVAHPVVFSIDTRTNSELPNRHRVLTGELEKLYGADDPAPARMPLILNDIEFIRSADGTGRALVSALGADAVFSLEYDQDGFLANIGQANKRFIDVDPGTEPGRLPIGVALLNGTASPTALVVNDATQNLVAIDLSAGAVGAVRATTDQVSHAAEKLNSDANLGRTLFATGLDKWSLEGKAWNSCETCHPDGLSDGLTWFFPRGPRRTLSAAATYAGTRRRVMLWTGNIDELHDIESIVRGVAGGAGAILWRYPSGTPDNTLRVSFDGSSIREPQKGPKPSSNLLNNLNGSLASIVGIGKDCLPDDVVCDKSPVTEWNQIDAYIQTVRAPRAPTNLVIEEVTAGAQLFEQAQCAGCHSGPAWSLSQIFYPPGAEYNGDLPYKALEIAPTAAQLGRLRTEKYGVPSRLRPIHPPGASGEATFRRWDPGARDPILHLYGTAETGYDSGRTHLDDQINCVLRAVGTFPVQPPAPETANVKGITVPGAPPVRELRQDMKTLALGETGFNIPPLLGLSVGAPYFHAGNARTLEEMFDERFAAHHQALSASFLTQQSRSQLIRELVAYLLSIDESTPALAADAGSLGFEPNLCAPGEPSAAVAGCDRVAPANIQECKDTLVSEGICGSLVNCACDRCACQIAACDADPDCRAIRQCVIAAGCCTAAGCNNSQCSGACPDAFRKIYASSTAQRLALDMNGCVFLQASSGPTGCASCPPK